MLYILCGINNRKRRKYTKIISDKCELMKWRQNKNTTPNLIYQNKRNTLALSNDYVIAVSCIIFVNIPKKKQERRRRNTTTAKNGSRTIDRYRLAAKSYVYFSHIYSFDNFISKNNNNSAKYMYRFVVGFIF